MSRIIAVDYGTKRIGLAVSDITKTIATPLCTISRNNITKYLIDYDKKNAFDTIIVGLSKNLNQEQSQIFYDIKHFTQKLTKIFPCKKILNVDERFTSVIAKRDLVFFKFKKKIRRDPSIIDMMSATLILQDFLEKCEK